MHHSCKCDQPYRHASTVPDPEAAKSISMNLRRFFCPPVKSRIGRRNPDMAAIYVHYVAVVIITRHWGVFPTATSNPCDLLGFRSHSTVALTQRPADKHTPSQKQMQRTRRFDAEHFHCYDLLEPPMTLSVPAKLSLISPVTNMTIHRQQRRGSHKFVVCRCLQLLIIWALQADASRGFKAFPCNVSSKC